MVLALILLILLLLLMMVGAKARACAMATAINIKERNLVISIVCFPNEVSSLFGAVYMIVRSFLMLCNR